MPKPGNTGKSATDSKPQGSYLMQFFDYNHLPQNLKEVSKPFCLLAQEVENKLPDNPEKSTCLQKLLEAKDCAVRAKIFED